MSVRPQRFVLVARHVQDAVRLLEGGVYLFDGLSRLNGPVADEQEEAGVVRQFLAVSEVDLEAGDAGLEGHHEACERT